MSRSDGTASFELKENWENVLLSDDCGGGFSCVTDAQSEKDREIVWVQAWHPYSCPVCGGRGIVPYGFYEIGTVSTNSPAIDQCRSCAGSGVVWG